MAHLLVKVVGREVGAAPEPPVLPARLIRHLEVAVVEVDRRHIWIPLVTHWSHIGHTLVTHW